VPNDADDIATRFHDLDDFLAIPRMTALRLSPDGTWLAAAVQTLSGDRKKYVTSVWRIDTGGGPARRLTRSAEGEGSPRFLPDGSLLFTSKRPDPDSAEDEGDGASAAALWLLPAGGGEARVVAALPGGVAGAETAADSDAIVVTSPVLAGAGAGGGNGPTDGNGTVGGEPTVADDERLRKERKDAGVSAILHESVPVRYWDHDLGPDDLRLFAVSVPPEEAPEDASGQVSEETTDVENAARDLTPDAGRALLEQSFTVSPDGAAAAAGWWRWRTGVQSHAELVRLDLTTGKRTVLLADPELDYGDPAFSPDGRWLACVRGTHHTAEKPHDFTLVLVDADGGEETDLLPDLDRWPAAPVWDPAGGRVYFTADDGGRRPVFGVDIRTREVTRVTDDGYYSELCPSRDGTALYALRAAVDEPPAPVRIALATGRLTRLDSPVARPALPGRLTEITATADDGHPIRSWLVLPHGASPEAKAPLLLWVHGGPMMSWNTWSWRANPWLMAALGYAVLLPDPALSSGYGQDFVARGYHRWGARPFGDVMAATDAAVRREDIDETRTAMLGASYGGYMANWIAGHTDRFRAIVSHAGLWTLEAMFGTTDMPMFWRPQFGDPLTAPAMYEENSPHRHIGNVKTPMLVIHGNLDYRVPLGEALRLWWDLKRHQVPAKFLYFPDENHWILKPGNSKAWYQTVSAFLAQYVRDEPWRRPHLL
jgi:dipeptidyl aminopeptidase/acylaminoacyl peptidase